MIEDQSTPEQEVKKEQEVQEQERPLTKREKVVFQRASEEAQRTMNLTVNRFVKFMAEEDLTDALIKEKRDALSRQWKTYCTIKHLNPQVFEAVANECDKIIKVYNSQKPNAD